MKRNLHSRRTVRDVDVSGKRVLVRADFNVPLKDGRIVDDTRIRATLPTIRYLIEHHATVLLCSHLGRPQGKVVSELRLAPVAERLSELLGQKVLALEDCVGTEVDRAVEQSGPGDILLLENTRFHAHEEENHRFFAAQLAKLCDLFVNDAFASAHREHASTVGVAHHVPAVAGLLLDRELSVIATALKRAERPFVVIIGGAKVADKIGVIESLFDRVDAFLLAGGVAQALLAAKGLRMGVSPLDEATLQTAGRILRHHESKLILPVDFIVADPENPKAKGREAPAEAIPDGVRIVDIGPQTIELFRMKLASARTVIWNGPLGVIETEPFAKGTHAIAQTLAGLHAARIVGGGDTGAALRQCGLVDQMTHVSTGGGAFLRLLENGELPAVVALDQQRPALAAA